MRHDRGAGEAGLGGALFGPEILSKDAANREHRRSRAWSADFDLAASFHDRTTQTALAAIALTSLALPNAALAASEEGPPNDLPDAENWRQLNQDLTVPAFARDLGAAPQGKEAREAMAAALNGSDSREDIRRMRAVSANVEPVTLFAGDCGPDLRAGPRRGRSSCPFDNSDLGMKVSSSFGQTQVFAGLAWGTASAWSPQRQLAGAGLVEQDRATLIGLSQNLFGNRVRMKTEMVWTGRQDRPWADTALLARGGQEHAGASRLVQIDATLLDGPSRQWTLKGEYSAVSEDIDMRQATVLGREIAAPGRRFAVSSALQLGKAGFTGALDSYRSSYGDESSRRLGIDLPGVAFALGSKKLRFQPAWVPGDEAMRSSITSMSLDIDLASPEQRLFAPLRKLGPFAPKSLSLAWRTGWSETGQAATRRRLGRRGWDMSASWKTPAGQTTLGYTYDTGLGELSQGGGKTNKTYKLAHAVDWRSWQLGGDVSMSRSVSTGATGFRENALSFGLNMAYAKPDQPQFNLRLGQDRDLMWFNSDYRQSASNALNVTASLDFTPLLRKRFERDDLRLKVEYRKRMDSSDERYALLENIFERNFARSDRSVFMLSAAMKF